jgi:hypothetical protein
MVSVQSPIVDIAPRRGMLQLKFTQGLPRLLDELLDDKGPRPSNKTPAEPQ